MRIDGGSDKRIIRRFNCNTEGSIIFRRGCEVLRGHEAHFDPKSFPREMTHLSTEVFLWSILFILFTLRPLKDKHLY